MGYIHPVELRTLKTNVRKMNYNFADFQPVYNGPVLSGHFLKCRLFAHTNAVFVTCIRRPPLLSGQFSKSRLFAHTNAVFVTCIRRPPLLSGQFSKSRLFAHTNAVFVTCIRRPPLLSGRGHPIAFLCLSFFVILPVLSGHP